MSDTLRELEQSMLRGMAQHLIYVGRVTATVAGEDDFAGSEPTDCALGKAILEHGAMVNERCSDQVREGWERLTAVHRDFHDASHRALATNDVEALQETELLSLRVVNLLGDLEETMAREQR